MHDFEAVEIRCPASGRLFLRVTARNAPFNGARLEVACRDCRNVARAAGEPVALVVHAFYLDGSLADTVTLAARP